MTELRAARAVRARQASAWVLRVVVDPNIAISAAISPTGVRGWRLLDRPIHAGHYPYMSRDEITISRDEALDIAACLFEAARLAEQASRFVETVEADRLHQMITMRLWPDLPEA